MAALLLTYISIVATSLQAHPAPKYDEQLLEKVAAHIAGSERPEAVFFVVH
jgi:hypothetical protein